MRNHYEYEVGHFENAIEMPSDTFREQFPMAADMLKDAKDKNIIMYCTGGIRCEKASAFMLHRVLKMFFTWKAALLITQTRPRNKDFQENSAAKILCSTIGLANE